MTTEEKVIQKSFNGDIPVKYEYADLYYDPKAEKFYMITKVGIKKITLEEVE